MKNCSYIFKDFDRSFALFAPVDISDMTTVVEHCYLSSSSLTNAESNAALIETVKELSGSTVDTLAIEDSRAIELIYAY